LLWKKFRTNGRKLSNHPGVKAKLFEAARQVRQLAQGTERALGLALEQPAQRAPNAAADGRVRAGCTRRLRGGLDKAIHFGQMLFERTEIAAEFLLSP